MFRAVHVTATSRARATASGGAVARPQREVEQQRRGRTRVMVVGEPRRGCWYAHSSAARAHAAAAARRATAAAQPRRPDARTAAKSRGSRRAGRAAARAAARGARRACARAPRSVGSWRVFRARRTRTPAGSDDASSRRSSSTGPPRAARWRCRAEAPPSGCGRARRALSDEARARVERRRRDARAARRTRRRLGARPPRGRARGGRARAGGRARSAGALGPEALSRVRGRREGLSPAAQHTSSAAQSPAALRATAARLPRRAACTRPRRAHGPAPPLGAGHAASATRGLRDVDGLLEDDGRRRAAEPGEEPATRRARAAAQAPCAAHVGRARERGAAGTLPIGIATTESASSAVARRPPRAPRTRDDAEQARLSTNGKERDARRPQPASRRSVSRRLELLGIAFEERRAVRRRSRTRGSARR